MRRYTVEFNFNYLQLFNTWLIVMFCLSFVNALYKWNATKTNSRVR